MSIEEKLFEEDRKNYSSNEEPVQLSLFLTLEGFEGLLISDEISMAALTGDLSSITKNVFLAGCDVVLHCNGKLDEMKKIVDKNQGFGVVSQKRANKFLIKLTELKKQRKAIDYMTMLASFNQSFGDSL